MKLPGGVPLDIVEEAVHAAARGRAQLLTIMEQAVPKVGGWALSRPVWLRAMHRPIRKQGRHGLTGHCSGGAHPLLPMLPWSVQERPASAPQHGSVRVPEGMLGRVIGSGGATVKEVEEAFDARIDIQDSGGCLGCLDCNGVEWGREQGRDAGSGGRGQVCELSSRVQPPPLCTLVSPHAPTPLPPHTPAASLCRPDPHLCTQPGGLPGGRGPHPGAGWGERQGVRRGTGLATAAWAD